MCVSGVKLFCVLCLAQWVRTENDTNSVYFSLILSGGEYGFRSWDAIPAIDIALEAIKDNQLLPAYNFAYKDERNSKCSHTDSLAAFFKDIESEAVPKIAVVGCGCSVATEPVAEISHYWNIPQISFASASASLDDRTRFNSFFRTIPSLDNYAPAILKLLQTFQWKKLAFLTQNEALFEKIVNDLRNVVNDSSTEYGSSDSHNIIIADLLFDTEEDPVAVARPIFEKKEFHVFFLNCYSKYARKLICEAFKQNLVYPNFAWTMYGWYPEKWWTNDVARDKLDECTDEDLENFLIMARPLIMDMIPEPDSEDAPTDTGFTAKNFTSIYTDRLDTTEFKKKSALRAIAFDAVWTLALVLNYTEEMRLRNQSKRHAVHENCSSNLTGDLVPLNEFNYSNAYMGCVMKHNFYKVNFTGVSGPVMYEENGTIAYTRIRFAQLRLKEKYGIERVDFGYMDIDSNYSLIFEENETISSIYPDGFPPDGTVIDVVHTYHAWLVAMYYVLALCGVVLSGICFAFNFFFRNREIVHLTSPVLSYVIVSGAVLMYLSVIIGFLPVTHKQLFRAQCIVHAWVYGIGYLLVYGTILAKMWRVHQIFHNPKPKQGLLKTWHMLCVVATIAGIGVLLLSTKTIVQVFYHPVLVPNSEDPDGTTGKDILEKHYVWRCYSSESHLLISDIIIFIYLSLLQFVGIVLAFQTRKVKITALNDSKSVTALIYISSIVLVVIVLITFILRSHINISAAVFSGGIIVLATFFLVLVFIPNVVNLYRDPAGEMIFDNMMSASTKVSNNTDHHTIVTGVFHQINGEKLNSHATN